MIGLKREVWTRAFNLKEPIKRIEKDNVNRFSKFKLDVRKGFSVEYPFIDKKTPSASANKSDVTSSGSKIIKPMKK